FEHRRRQQEDPVLRDALWPGGAVVLLLEDQPLPQRRLAAAVLRRPRHHCPLVLEEHAFPDEVLIEAVACVTAERMTADAVVPFGQVRLQPAPRFSAEGLLFLCPREVHQVESNTDDPWPKRPWF